MKIGVLKEIADSESRIAITPDIVKKLIQMKCEVFIEKDAGIKADISNQDFINEGAIIVSKSKVIDTEIILKVRAPSPDEIKSLKEDTIGRIDDRYIVPWRPVARLVSPIQPKSLPLSNIAQRRR